MGGQESNAPLGLAPGLQLIRYATATRAFNGKNSMRFLKHIAAPILAVVVLTACGGGGAGGNASAQSPKERIAALEAEGKLPKLDRSSDLKGPDLNGDGVRDDIEAILKAKYKGQQLAATKQFARSYQAVFDLPDDDHIAAKALINKASRGLKCVFIKFQGDENDHPTAVSQAIESMTFNTKGRLNAYLRLNKILDGSVLSWPQGDTCE